MGELRFTLKESKSKWIPETGKVRILRIVSAHDVATIINPVLHQGQIEGGMVQGLGFSLMEDLADEDGKIAAVSLGDYKMPNIRDVPMHHTVFVRDAWGPAPYEGKAIGEHSTSPTAPPLPTPSMMRRAYRSETPITAEMIYNALQERRSNPVRLTGRAGARVDVLCRISSAWRICALTRRGIYL